jgi:hypothetical protein
MAMSATVACAAFGAICGSSLATAATMGQVAIPELKRHGCSGKLTTATLAASGTLGILIPPSVPLVVYAVLTQESIGKLFVAAVIPGLIAALGRVRVRRQPAVGRRDRRNRYGQGRTHPFASHRHARRRVRDAGAAALHADAEGNQGGLRRGVDGVLLDARESYGWRGPYFESSGTGQTNAVFPLN